MTSASLPAATRRPPHFWWTFLVNILLPGAGLPWIGLHWPYLIFLVVGHLISGPVARLLWGPGVPGWGVTVTIILAVALSLGFPRLYDRQFPKGQPARALPPLTLRLMGVWLPVLVSVLTRLGYAVGLFTLPAQ